MAAALADFAAPPMRAGTPGLLSLSEAIPSNESARRVSIENVEQVSESEQLLTAVSLHVEVAEREEQSVVGSRKRFERLRPPQGKEQLGKVVSPCFVHPLRPGCDL